MINFDLELNHLRLCPTNWVTWWLLVLVKNWTITLLSWISVLLDTIDWPRFALLYHNWFLGGTYVFFSGMHQKGRWKVYLVTLMRMLFPMILLVTRGKIFHYLFTVTAKVLFWTVINASMLPYCLILNAILVIS